MYHSASPAIVGVAADISPLSRYRFSSLNAALGFTRVASHYGGEMDGLIAGGYVLDHPIAISRPLQTGIVSVVDVNVATDVVVATDNFPSGVIAKTTTFTAKGAEGGVKLHTMSAYVVEADISYGLVVAV